MSHETPLLFTLAIGFALAFALGLVAHRLRLPPLVGYLVAGVIVGPFTPGYVANATLARELAEVGVILLMFGVGLHFSVGDLLAVRRVAVPGALAHMTLGAALGALLSHTWGWSWGGAIVFGVALSIASTVVLLRALEQRGILDNSDGRIALGWLVVEDLATVLLLVILPAVVSSAPSGGAAGGSLWLALAMTIAKAIAFLVVMLVVGRRVLPWILEHVARTGSRELFTLAVLVAAVGVAVGAAALFGVSFALGAFFAGVVVNESDLSHQAAADALPLQDAFAVLFFLSVGMLFDPAAVLKHPLEILEVLVLVVLLKPILALPIMFALRQSARTTLTVAASMGQIGEFSFIVAALGLSVGVLPPEGQSYIVAGALLSITLNQLLFAVVDPVDGWLRRQPWLASLVDRRRPDIEPEATAPGGHVVLVGHGRVGSAIARVLDASTLPYVVIERDRRIVDTLRQRGKSAVFGNAARPGILAAAHVDRARLLIITTPDPFETRHILLTGRQLSPTLETVARTHSAAEQAYLDKAGVAYAVMGEQELAASMAKYALELLERHPDGGRDEENRRHHSL